MSYLFSAMFSSCVARFVGHPRGMFGLEQVFGEPFQHQLLEQVFIHDERLPTRQRGGAIKTHTYFCKSERSLSCTQQEDSVKH